MSWFAVTNTGMGYGWVAFAPANRVARLDAVMGALPVDGDGAGTVDPLGAGVDAGAVVTWDTGSVRRASSTGALGDPIHAPARFHNWPASGWGMPSAPGTVGITRNTRPSGSVPLTASVSQCLRTPLTPCSLVAWASRAS